MEVTGDWVFATYWICLMVGILYTVLSLLLGGIADVAGHIGVGLGAGHGDFSHDYGVDGHSGHGEASGMHTDGGQVIFSPFSPLVVAFFLTCFGASGILLGRIFQLQLIIGMCIAVCAAAALAWAFISLGNHYLGGMQVSSEVRLSTLLGTEAEVTVAIPETGIGEIAYIAMGGRTVGPARSEDMVPIARFATVRIARIVGNIFFVRQVVEDQYRTLETTPSGRTTPFE